MKGISCFLHALISQVPSSAIVKKANNDDERDDDDDDDDDDDEKKIDAHTVMRASRALILLCMKTSDKKHQFNIDDITQHDRITLAHSRVEQVAQQFLGVSSDKFRNVSLDDEARILLLCSVRSPIKDTIVSHIMSLAPSLQQELMLDIRETEEKLMHHSLNDTSSMATDSTQIQLESSSASIISTLDVSQKYLSSSTTRSSEQASTQIERLRRLLAMSEEDARESARAAEEIRALAEVEKTTRINETNRLHSQLQSLQDELDVTRERAKKVAALQLTIKQYEARMDDAASLATQLVHAKESIQQEKIRHVQRKGDGDEQALALESALIETKAALTESDAALHGARIEKDSLLAQMKTLSTELAQREIEMRSLQQKLSHVDQLREQTSQSRQAVKEGLDTEINEVCRVDVAVQVATLNNEQQQQQQQLIQLQTKMQSNEDALDNMRERILEKSECNKKLQEQLESEATNYKRISCELCDVLAEKKQLQKALEMTKAKLNRRKSSKENRSTNDKAEPRVEDLVDELSLMSSAVHNMVLDVQRRKIKNNVLGSIMPSTKFSSKGESQ